MIVEIALGIVLAIVLLAVIAGAGALLLGAGLFVYLKLGGWVLVGAIIVLVYMALVLYREHAMANPS